MKSVALIHTVRPLLDTFDVMLKNSIDYDIKIHNLFDDFLANNPNEIGEFSIDNYNRLYNDIKTAEMTNPDLIVVTCSTLSPIVSKIRPFVKVPIIAIDDMMTKKAVVCGEKILILATAGSTEMPLREKLSFEADLINKNIDVSFIANKEAFAEMKKNNMKDHDKLLLETAKEIKGYDCIVLAQASMAHLDEKIEKISGIKTFSSTSLCIEEVRDKLKNL